MRLSCIRHQKGAHAHTHLWSLADVSKRHSAGRFRFLIYLETACYLYLRFWIIDYDGHSHSHNVTTERRTFFDGILVLVRFSSRHIPKIAPRIIPPAIPDQGLSTGWAGDTRVEGCER